MKKKIKDCTYKEVSEYYKNNVCDTDIAMLLGAFGKPFMRNEHSWRLRIMVDFPRVFKEEFLNREIDV